MHLVQSSQPIGTLAEAVAAANRARSLPAYHREWKQGEITAETWAEVPLLSKERLIEAAATSGPYGDRLGVPPSDVAWVFLAPGPIYMPYTVADMDEIAARFASTFASCGITADDVVDQTTLYNWVIAATGLGRGIERLGATAVPGGSGDTNRHIEAIAELGVTAILAFPTFLVHLLDTAAAQGRTLPLRRAVVMGEMHDPREKQRVLDVYGISVREYYGTADVGPVAAECREGAGMHLRHGVYTEFVDPETGGVVERPEPGRPAELVVTDLVRQGMPIIRLRTGDLIDDLITDACPCGDPAPRLRRIIGRTGDITKVKGMFVVPASVGEVLRRHGLDMQYQLLVSRESGRDTLSVHVVGTQPADWAAVYQDIEAALRMRCTYEFVDGLAEDGLLRDLRVLA
jgi:phenylacetate-CoA ligase